MGATSYVEVETDWLSQMYILIVTGMASDHDWFSHLGRGVGHNGAVEGGVGLVGHREHTCRGLGQRGRAGLCCPNIARSTELIVSCAKNLDVFTAAYQLGETKSGHFEAS